MSQKATSFEQKMDGFEETFHRFLTSPDYPMCLIDHCCHSRTWHYDHQVLKVELFPDGTWHAPSEHSWSQGGSCVVVLGQIGFHLSAMEAIGETKDFEDILTQDARGAAWAVAERLYASQEEAIREWSLRHFASLRERGSLD